MTPHRTLAVVVMAFVLASDVWAQQPDDTGRGVARISLMNGDVSVRRGDSGDLVAAALNAPLVVQDRVFTGISSRAEVQFDWANFLRLSHNAEVRLAELEWRRYLVQLAQGSVTWRVLRDLEAAIEISTPTVSVRPVRKGTYRITVVDDGSTEITVRSGEAEIFTPRGSERLRSGRTMFVRGTQADPEFRVGPEIPDDEWDRWNLARDRDLERSRSYQYVSRDIYGAEDLDDHGRWVNVSSYGWVWSPRVAVGWAPYRHGRWSWIDWYGWSWVSYDPWGWAPYHYGRWFYHAPVGWCWWPGSISVRHRWSPGFVAFVGFGSGSVGAGWGRVGWIPLAPHEPYHPWYGRNWYGGYRSHNYLDNRVTVVNNVNVTNIYRNSRITNAVTVVDNDDFRRGRFTDTVRVNSDDFRTVSLARGPVPVTPERANLRLADREPAVRPVTERAGGDRFFSSRRPPEVDRVSFEDQRRGVDQLARRSFSDGVATRSASSEGSRAGTSDQQRGWRRLNEGQRTGESSSRGGAAAGDMRRSLTGSSGSDVAGSDRSASPDGMRRFGGATHTDSAAASAMTTPNEGTRGGAVEWRRFGGGSRSEPSDTGRNSIERSSGRSGVVDSRGSGASDDRWRRFGSPRVESNSTEGQRSGISDSRSFGEPSARGGTTLSGDTTRSFADGARSQPAANDPGERRSGVSERSGRFGGRSGESSSPSAETPAMERRDFGNSDRGSSIRISPPIVRERGGEPGGMRSFGGGARSAPSGESGGGGGMVRGGDGGGRSTPSSAGPSGGGGRSGDHGGGGRSRGR